MYEGPGYGSHTDEIFGFDPETSGAQRGRQQRRPENNVKARSKIRAVINRNSLKPESSLQPVPLLLLSIVLKIQNSRKSSIARYYLPFPWTGSSFAVRGAHVVRSEQDLPIGFIASRMVF